MSVESGSAETYTMRCMELRGGSAAVAESLSTPGLDAWVYSQPHEGAESGGDLYYLSLCGGGLITRLIVADVSGHGETVAGFSSILCALMRRNINTKEQTRLVQSLNRQFSETAQLRRFATAVIATYLANHKRLTICNAGHPRPLWYRAAQNDWLLLTANDEGPGNLPLGIDDESVYGQFSVVLGPGDLVLLYTDALIEAIDGAGQMLGETGLLALARQTLPSAPHHVGPALLDAVQRYRGGQPANDDVTLVTLHHNAAGPRRMSLGEKLDVYAKVFGLKAY